MRSGVSIFTPKAFNWSAMSPDRSALPLKQEGQVGKPEELEPPRYRRPCGSSQSTNPRMGGFSIKPCSLHPYHPLANGCVVGCAVEGEERGRKERHS
jgi:hypothetical protein